MPVEGNASKEDPSLPWSVLSLSMAAIALLFAAPFAGGQSTGGRIRGTVTDASGAAVAGAKVGLINEATGVLREATTSAAGEYVFLEVSVGTYDVEVTQRGFKKLTRKVIPLDLNEVISVDVSLQIGGNMETIEVTGAPPIVDTTTTQLGTVVNSRDVTQLPLSARDTYQLLQLQPGVQAQLGNDLFYGSDKAGVVTVNGGRGRSNNYSVNGSDGNDLFANLPAVQPSPDSIEEFRVITNSFDAEYGRNSGAVVNVVTKSGTNRWHGSAYEFFRNKVLNAKGFYDPVRPDFIQNQFGGTLGGPIKADKTFFFASYEGRRLKRGISSTPVVVPSAAELVGDFSAGGAFSGMLTDSTLASVLNERCGSRIDATGPGPTIALNKAVAGTPQAYSAIFPGNRIPTQCFDPLATQLLSNVPAPNTGLNVFQKAPMSQDRGDQFSMKVDHNLSNSQKLATYYYFDDDNRLDPFAKFQAAGGDVGNFPGVYASRTQQVNSTHTWTIGATSVNELRLAYFRQGQGKFNTPTKTSLVQDSCGSGPASMFCFTGTSDANTVNTICATADCSIHPRLGASKEGLPYIFLNGGFSIGNNFQGQLPQTGNTYQLADNFSKIIGSHSLKFGGDARYQKFDLTLYYNVNGWYNFTSSFSSPTGNDVGFTDPYANYLLGIPANFSQGAAQKELVRSKSVYLFAQDSWKLKPTLTVNYGLRWEINTPLADAGQKVTTFRPGEVSQIYPCVLPPTSPLYIPGRVTTCDQAGVTPVGLVVPGDKGVPKGLYDTYYKGFAPRLGLNWSPGWRDGAITKLTGGPEKTTISMGWGLFYNPMEALVLEQFAAGPPFGVSNFILNPLFQTPFVSQSGLVNPNPANGFLNPPRGSQIDWENYRSLLQYGAFPAQLRTQYSAQYNVTIKRQLPGNILFQVGYVGSQGHRLLASYDANYGNPHTCNDLQAIAVATGNASLACGPKSADNPYFIPAGTVIPSTPDGGLLLPYNPDGPLLVPAGTTVGPNGITLVGLRKYASPLCHPLSGAQCPADGLDVFSNIFTQNSVAHSNYNSLQALLAKRVSHGLQFQAAYTYSKSLDNASSFESSLNPLNFNATYGTSLYDARHRLVFSYVWDLPVPQYNGFIGKIFDGWQVSSIVTFQKGFPVRITSSDDVEEFSSFDFEAPGEPNWTTGPGFTPGRLQTWDPRKHGGFAFDPGQFTNATVAPGTIGNAPRSVCCSPGINNWDMGFFKDTLLGEKLRMEFRGEIFNIWNHSQFYSVDGNISDGPTFGQAQHARDPRLFQFAMKFVF